jgi:hypothetical protein
MRLLAKMKNEMSLLALITALTGCALPNAPSRPTPARLEAVCRWGAYLTALHAGLANQEPMRKAALVMKQLAASEKLTPGAVATALQSAGMTWIQCPEGVLALEVALMFDDAMTGPARVEDEQSLRAVLRGVSSGILLALQLLDGDGTVSELKLEQDARALR